MEEKKIVLGSGMVTLDQLQKFADDTVSEEYVGGTLGNIMMIMAHYGWHAMPVTRLDVSVDSEKMVDDMKASGMDLRYVIREEGGKTPVIFQRNYIKRDGSKGKSIGAPEGRSRFIPFSAITKKTAKAIIEELNEVPDVLVFDRAYPAYIDLAKHFKDDTEYTDDGAFRVLPMGRLVNVKIEHEATDEEYEALRAALESHYVDDERVTEVYRCRAGAIMIDCRH